MRRFMGATAVLVATACLVATTSPVVADSARAVAPQQQPNPQPAFTVDGRATPFKEVVADLVALARNGQLGIVAVDDTGDRVPVRGVIATWMTKVIYAAVIAAELQRRGVAITAEQRALARRYERHAYGPPTWRAFPPGFRTRQVERTAGAIALAQDQGLDLTKPRRTRRALVAFVTELSRRASVTVAPRFGTWDPQLAVVVPPLDGPPS
jgi:hypothetical protein